MKTLSLTKVFLKDMVRQKSVIFSSFILPLVIIWSTWWVTADIPMAFELTGGEYIVANMIDVHVVTGGLTAMGITAGLFGFLITTKNKVIISRLQQVGYPRTTVNLASFLALMVVLIFTSAVAILYSGYLAGPEDYQAFTYSIFLITIIYAAVGNLIGSISDNITSGSLFILIFSFMDLMLFTNPMGEGLYLQGWTYFIPGFWPVQLSLEAGFIGAPNDLLMKIGYAVLYFLVLIIVISIINLPKFRSYLNKIGGRMK